MVGEAVLVLSLVVVVVAAVTDLDCILRLLYLIPCNPLAEYSSIGPWREHQRYLDNIFKNIFL